MNLLFMIRTVVPGGQQNDTARCLIDDRSRISANIVCIVPYGNDFTPGLPTVGGAAQDKIDVSRITAAVFPGFGKSQDRTFGCQNGRRNAIGIELSLIHI